MNWMNGTCDTQRKGICNYGQKRGCNMDVNYKLIIVGGIRRTGTNFINFCFFLHPDILSTIFGAFKQTFIKSSLHTNENMNYSEFRNHTIKSYKVSEGHRPYAHQIDIPGLGEYFDEKAKIDNEFKCITFKGDFAESQCSHIVERLEFPVLFIYLARNCLDRFISENRFFRPNTGLDAKVFVQQTKDSLDGVSKIKKLNNVTFKVRTVFNSHEQTREWFSDIMAEIGLPLSEWQKKFLEKQRRVSASGGAPFNAEERQPFLERLYAVPDYESVSKEYEKLCREDETITR